MTVLDLTMCAECELELAAGCDAHVVPGGPYGVDGYLFVHPGCCVRCQEEAT